MSSTFDLQRINALELAILGELKYSIRVSASEYAKYYFHLRSLMARLGFNANESSLLQPLNVSQARRMQLATEKFARTSTEFPRRRSKTAEILELKDPMRSKRVYTMEDIESKLFGNQAMVGLEQLIHSNHMDADGAEHTSRKNTIHAPPRSHVDKPRDVFESTLARKAFRTENCKSWNAGDDEDFKYTRK